MTKHHKERLKEETRKHNDRQKANTKRRKKEKLTGKKALPFSTGGQNKKKYVRFDIRLKKLKEKQQNYGQHCET